MNTTLTAGQYCTFRVDGLFFGVAVEDVQEVLRHQPMTRVPRAQREISGLINLRGQIVTAVDLRVRLGLPERPDGRLPMNVIVRSRGEIVSILVDSIGDVIDVADSAEVGLQPVPSTVPRGLRDVVHGVRPLPEGILLVLDIHRALEVPA